jgi:hypothetical protein
MPNIVGLRAVMVVALLALVCKAGLAQIGPRYLIEIKEAGGGGGSAAARGYKPGQGRVKLVGKGLVLIRFKGLRLLTVGADADAYSAESVRHWPAVDLVLVTPPNVGRYAGLAPLAALRKLPVILVEPAGGMTVPPLASSVSSLSALSAQDAASSATSTTASTTAGRDDGPRYYPMQTWDALHLRMGKGNGNNKTWLRVTAMPGQPGTSHVAGFVLEMGDSRASYRVYISCEALEADEIKGLSQRLPGSDLALLPDGDAPRLLALRRATLAGGKVPAQSVNGLAVEPAVELTTLTAAGYAFHAIKR